MFVSGGENVYPEIIEKALLELEGVTAARVEPVNDDDWGQAAVARVAVSSDGGFDERKLRDLLKTKLLPFQVPKRIFRVEGPAVPWK